MGRENVGEHRAIPRRDVVLGAAACLLGGWSLLSGTASGSERADHSEAHPDRAGPHTDDDAARLRLDPGALIEVQTARPALALTFDDGPDPAYTPDVLRALRSAGVTATFFVIGRNATRYPDLVLQLVEEGHEVANHQAKGIAEAAAIVVGEARAGSVILCHDGGHLDGPNPQAVDRSRMVRALPGILDGVLAKGLVPVRLTDLVALAGA